MEGLVRITGDTFDIADRLRAIDPDYTVYYNLKQSRYELHNERCRPTLQLVLPYKTLDKRAVDYCLKTRIERAIDTARRIDEENQKEEEAAMRKLADESAYKLKELTEYVSKGGSDLPEYRNI